MPRDRKGQRYRGIEMRTGYMSDGVDRNGDGESPHRRDDQWIKQLRRMCGSHDAAAPEEHHDECADRLGGHSVEQAVSLHIRLREYTRIYAAASAVASSLTQHADDCWP